MAVASQDHQRSVVMRRRDERRTFSAFQVSRALRGRADRPNSLLRLILRGVRQRTFVILNPCVISGIDPAVARFASEKMLSLTDASPVGAFAEQPSRGLGSSSDVIAVILIP
jgi:hypothetical protein